jgi:hypothetical protein
VEHNGARRYMMNGMTLLGLVLLGMGTLGVLIAVARDV